MDWDAAPENWACRRCAIGGGWRACTCASVVHMQAIERRVLTLFGVVWLAMSVVGRWLLGAGWQRVGLRGWSGRCVGCVRVFVVMECGVET